MSTVKSKCKIFIDTLVRVYIVITLSLIMLYCHQKYIVTYDDIIVEVPATFLENEYINTDVVTNYAMLATTVDNQVLTATTAIDCKIDGIWERQTQIGPNSYPFSLDEERLADARAILAELEGIDPDTQQSVDIIRRWGNEIAARGGWAFAWSFDISNLDFPEPTECRLKIYRETTTKYFDIPKVKAYVTNSTMVQRSVSN